MSQAIYYIQANTPQMQTLPAHPVNLPVNEMMAGNELMAGNETVVDKSILLASLGQACDFPDDAILSWRHNWDSAYDCLTDAVLQQDICHLLLDLSAIERIDTEDLNVFKSLIEDAYSDFGKPHLWIVR